MDKVMKAKLDRIKARLAGVREVIANTKTRNIEPLQLYEQWLLAAWKRTYKDERTDQPA
mgnify:CR=1 FL=1